MSSSQTTALLLALALIAAVARLGGAAARRCGQPAVVGEIVAGILLGPTVLPAQVTEALFPPAIRGELSAFADIGLALFMFALGMEFDWSAKRSLRKTSFGIAVSAMVFPFALGVGLGLWWGPGESSAPRLGHVLFMGIALSVTAFPVLARIIEDRGLSRSPLGQLAVAGAAICDVLAWVLLGGVMMLGGGGAPWRLVCLIPYLVVMVVAVRPALRHVMRRAGAEVDLVVAFVGVLASAAATEWMGLHFIFGAFVFGIVRTSARRGLGARVDNRLRQGLGSLGSRLFMPVFFVVAGWKVDLSVLGLSHLLDLLVLLVAAVAGKFLAAAGAARLAGMGARDSAAIGALMNTRGLTELIVLTAGREAGLLDDRRYTLLVAMAVLTTMSTGPVLKRLLPTGPARSDAGTGSEVLPESSETLGSSSAGGPDARLGDARPQPARIDTVRHQRP
ncbi:cation:proton antiporter [Streptomyces palmae]|uniref:Cation/H(+) antiporter n=1 Tax=Streptomyces palmae TaxID=1701085 RepID=A0A4Z0H1R8_9ACTN|nr:cation:proton antiporter [Streptomyces palmae]TGB03063.1 cation/H(+) antiporter [Streptomyces palmae]